MGWGRLSLTSTFAALLVAWTMACAHAETARRVALVIGNAIYADAGTLANPVNDATDMATKLRSIGFEVVEGHNLGKRDLERKIGEFSDALAGASVGMFFYAGHGVQVDGRNYILPVDARLDQSVKLRLEAVPIDEVLDIMESQTETSLVFLDACRNNPFSRSVVAGKRAATALQGLAQFDSSRGSFIAFSTAPDAVALDGTGRNSPFAAALVNHIATPGQSINDLMIAVRRDVIAATNNSQRPWEQGSLLSRFEFVPSAGLVSEGRQNAPAHQPSVQSDDQVAMARSIVDTSSIESFIVSGYLKPDGASMRETVRKLYADPALVYGTSLGFDALVKTKQEWFGQFSKWSLGLIPGTLTVSERGENNADVTFDMTYDYQPSNAGGQQMIGRARVTLGLVASDGGWKVVSETSQALP